MFGSVVSLRNLDHPSPAELVAEKLASMSSGNGTVHHHVQRNACYETYFFPSKMSSKKQDYRRRHIIVFEGHVYLPPPPHLVDIRDANRQAIVRIFTGKQQEHNADTVSKAADHISSSHLSVLFDFVQVHVPLIITTASLPEDHPSRPDMKSVLHITIHLCGQRRDEQEFPSRHGPRR
jgi:hypothetical protein